MAFCIQAEANLVSINSAREASSVRNISGGCSALACQALRQSENWDEALRLAGEGIATW